MPRIQPPAPAPPREADVLAEIRIAFGQEPDLVLWRLSQGAGVLVPVRTLESLCTTLQRAGAERDWTRVAMALAVLEGLDRFTRAGMVPGAADLIGILRGIRDVDVGACDACRGTGLCLHDPFGSNCRTCAGGGRAHESRPWGRFIALEAKRPAGPGRARGRTSEEQDQWLSLVRRMGGFAAVVDSVDAARAALERARRGYSE